MALKKNYQRTRCRFSGSGKMTPNDGKSKAGGKRKMLSLALKKVEPGMSDWSACGDKEKKRELLRSLYLS